MILLFTSVVQEEFVIEVIDIEHDIGCSLESGQQYNYSDSGTCTYSVDVFGRKINYYVHVAVPYLLQLLCMYVVIVYLICNLLIRPEMGKLFCFT